MFLYKSTNINIKYYIKLTCMYLTSLHNTSPPLNVNVTSHASWGRTLPNATNKSATLKWIMSTCIRDSFDLRMPSDAITVPLPSTAKTKIMLWMMISAFANPSFRSKSWMLEFLVVFSRERMFVVFNSILILRVIGLIYLKCLKNTDIVNPYLF